MINPNSCGMYLCIKCLQWHTIAENCPKIITLKDLIEGNYAQIK